MAPIEGSRRCSRLWGGFTLPFDLPPLRHFVTSLLKERLFVRLPLRGAGGVAVCGVALFSLIYYLPLWRPMIAPTNVKLSSF